MERVRPTECVRCGEPISQPKNPGVVRLYCGGRCRNAASAEKLRSAAVIERLPNLPPDPSPTALPEYLAQRVTVTPSGCWQWTATLNSYGYGMSTSSPWLGMAHRVVYALVVGPIPEGLQLDHLCCSPEWCRGGVDCPHRRCVRPSHLEPVTGAENARRGNHRNGARKGPRERTHCPAGHPYDDENTRWNKGTRMCRTCHREREAARRAALDPEQRQRYRESVNAAVRAHRADPEKRARERERARSRRRERYASDPDYRARELARDRQRRARASGTA